MITTTFRTKHPYATVQQATKNTKTRISTIIVSLSANIILSLLQFYTKIPIDQKKQHQKGNSTLPQKDTALVGHKDTH